MTIRMTQQEYHDRALRIIELLSMGATGNELGAAFGLGRERIRQIVSKCYRIARHPRYAGDSVLTPPPGSTFYMHVKNNAIIGEIIIAALSDRFERLYERI